MMDSFARARSFMSKAGIDAWVVYDFRGSNPVFGQLVPSKPETTRRSFLIVPADAEPILLVHLIERPGFEVTGIQCDTFDGWDAMIRQLRGALSPFHRVAMEYSPRGELPTMSWVDAGTWELVSELGVEVVSSADLFQAALATWTEEGLQSHEEAVEMVAAVKDEAFELIRHTLASGKTLDECDVQRFITSRFETLDLEADHDPIVAVNAHSADPHYVPHPANCSPIERGDWLLIDLWARKRLAGSIFADMTWVGCAASAVADDVQEVFDIVAGARDLLVSELALRMASGRDVEGWELDEVAREHIAGAGFADGIVHRVGHSLGPGPRVHGLGVNLDNLETRDRRRILPGAGFTVEPGIYLEKFGVRLEINVYVEHSGPRVTTPVQSEIVLF